MDIAKAIDTFNLMVMNLNEDDLDRAKGALVIAYEDAANQCRDRVIDHLKSAVYYKRHPQKFVDCLLHVSEEIEELKQIQHKLIQVCNLANVTITVKEG